LDELVDLGYSFISVGVDMIGLWQYWAGLGDAIFPFKMTIFVLYFINGT
jgi:predicted small integral membrane protein